MSQRSAAAQTPETSSQFPSPHGREKTPLWKTELGLLQLEFLHLSTLPSRPYSSAYQHSQHPETLGSSYASGKTDPMTLKNLSEQNCPSMVNYSSITLGVSSNWTVITETSHSKDRAEREESSIKQKQQGSSHRCRLVRRHSWFIWELS